MERVERGAHRRIVAGVVMGDDPLFVADPGDGFRDLHQRGSARPAKTGITTRPRPARASSIARAASLTVVTTSCPCCARSQRSLGVVATPSPRPI
jgi:hypothetical protein